MSSNIVWNHFFVQNSGNFLDECDITHRFLFINAVYKKKRECYVQILMKPKYSLASGAKEKSKYNKKCMRN